MNKQKMKQYFEYILIICILLSILYFIYRYYEEKSVRENFEGLNTQTSSVYYKNMVDSNDILKKSHFSKYTKSPFLPYINASTILKSNIDNFTGSWYNYNMNNTTYTPSATDSILVLRKINNQIQFTIVLNNINSVDSTLKGDDLSTAINAPYYSLNGMCQIDSDDNTKATVLNVVQNRYNNQNAKLIDGTITSTITDLTKFIGEQIKFDKDSKKITFLSIDFNYSKRNKTLAGNSSNYGSGDKIFVYNKDIIQPFYNMDSTQFADINCPIGKQLCTFASGGNNYYGCSSTINDSDKSCDISSENISNICSLGSCSSGSICTNTTGSLSVNDNSSSIISHTINQCSPQYNITMNGKMDSMLNKINDDTTGNLRSCTYMNGLTNGWDYYYILYFRSSSDVSSLSFQYWGEEPSDSRLVMIKTKLDQSLKNNSDIKTYVQQILGESTDSNSNHSLARDNMKKISNNKPVKWSLNSDLGKNSCYFSIHSKSTSTKPPYYIQSEPNGFVHMTLLEGGTNKYFTLEQENTATESFNNINIYSGYLRASNGLYLSPGTSSISELVPSSSNIDAKVCTLVSKPNVSGKWVIVACNKDFTKDDLSGLS